MFVEFALEPGHVDHARRMADLEVLDLHAHIDEQRLVIRLQKGPGLEWGQMLHLPTILA